MSAIVIRAQLDSTTLNLPELAPLVGKHVEIVVREDSVASGPFSSSPTAASELLEEAVVESGALSRLA